MQGEKMKKILVAVLLGLVGCSNTTADDAPIRVSIEYRTTQSHQTGEYFQYPNLRIRAIADQVEIMDLEGNDGDCAPLPFVNPKLPVILKKRTSYRICISNKFLSKSL